MPDAPLTMPETATQQEPKVFVAIPSYNHAQFVEECIRSVMAQTQPPLKLLVIDDGSSDDSPHTISRCLENCPFESELIVRENRGLCATLNQALSLSSGEYFAYLGSDDYWLPGFLAARSSMLDRTSDAVLVYGNAFLLDDAGNILTSTAQDREYSKAYSSLNAEQLMYQFVIPISSSVCYRRSALEIFGWNERARLEDYELLLKLAGIGSFGFDPKVLSVWRKHSHNTSKDLVLMLDEVLAIQQRHAEDRKLTSEELCDLQAVTKFKFARMFLQQGERSRSFRLSLKSWRGADSYKQLFTYFLRCAVPMSLVRSIRRRRMQKFSAPFSAKEQVN